MTAFLLAPFYILVNVYVVRWMIRWMGACSHIFQSAVFRAVFIIFYILIASSLLTGFLINKPEFLHRILKNTGNYFSRHISLHYFGNCSSRPCTPDP